MITYIEYSCLCNAERRENKGWGDRVFLYLQGAPHPGFLCTKVCPMSRLGVPCSLPLSLSLSLCCVDAVCGERSRPILCLMSSMAAVTSRVRRRDIATGLATHPADRSHSRTRHHSGQIHTDTRGWSSTGANSYLKVGELELNHIRRLEHWS